MSRGSSIVTAKVLREFESRAGCVPVAKILLPQFSAATPIRLMSNTSRRIAEARPRRPI